MVDRSSAEVFVGREASLASLSSALHDAVAGSSRFVLVEGSAGIGKTALLERCVRGLTDCRVVRVSGVEAEMRVPFGVATQLLRDLGATSLTAPSGPVSVDAHEEVTEVGARLLAVLGEEGKRATVIVIDDAQWVDAPSLQAVTFAFRRLDADGVLVAACARPNGEASRILERLAAGPRGALVRLEPLAVDEVSELAAAVGRPLSPAAARRLWAHTGGLPLHLVALLDEMDPVALNRATGPLPAPRSFATFVLQRVAALASDGESLVASAAVLGDRCRLAQAAGVAGLEDPLPAVDAAVRAGLVECVRDASGDEIKFVHALVRAAVLDALAPLRLAALHRRAADCLDGVAALEHRAAAVVLPEAALAGALAAAGRRALQRGAVDEGVHLLLEGARLDPDAESARACRLDALEALLWGGALVAADALAHELADELADVDDPRALYLRGFLALLNGSQAECEELLVAAWARRDPDDATLGSLIATRLAQLFNIFGMAVRTGDGVTWAERSMTLASADPSGSAFPNAILLVSLVLAGRPDEARARAVPENATGDAVASGNFDDVLGRGIVKLWTDDLAGARSDLVTAATSVGGRTPELVTRLWALGFRADAEYRAGRWDDSVSTAELAVSLAEDAEHRWLLGVLHGVAALPAAGRGDWPAATAHVEAALATTAVVNNLTSLVYAATAEATLAMARADHGGVVAATDALHALDPARGALEPGVLDWCALRIEALVALYRLEEAAELADQAETMAASRDRRSAIVAIGRARGVLNTALGDEDDALVAFERAERNLDGLGMPFTAGLLHLAHGRHLRRRGERRAAAGRLQAALDAFGPLGARPYIEQAEAELAVCGLTPRRRGPAAPTLTPREHGIAQLVGDGLTNREIAERLVVSVKTVEYHLANAFTKLGVRSRAQLAARVAAAVPEEQQN